MENHTQIRSAGFTDIPTISNLAHTIWPISYGDILSADQIAYMLNLFYSDEALAHQLETDQFLVVNIGGEPSGFASFALVEGPGIFKLNKLYVKPVLHGKGLGKLLIDHIIKEIKLLQATALILDVNRQNKARYFYEKLGFTIIGEQDKDIGNTYQMNDYVMRLLL